MPSSISVFSFLLSKRATPPKHTQPYITAPSPTPHSFPNLSQKLSGMKVNLSPPRTTQACDSIPSFTLLCTKLWLFVCLSEDELSNLKEGKYRVMTAGGWQFLVLFCLFLFFLYSKVTRNLTIQDSAVLLHCYCLFLFFARCLFCSFLL